jgi:hypothetical protein
MSRGPAGSDRTTIEAQYALGEGGEAVPYRGLVNAVDDPTECAITGLIWKLIVKLGA